MTARTALSPAVREAIAWEVRLREGDIADDDLRQFARWREDAGADAAWNALQLRLGRPQAGVGAQAVAQALRTDAAERRRLLRAGFGVAALCAFGAGGRGLWQGLGYDADWRSATGERRALQLADGTPMTLDAGSRVYQSGSTQAPRLRLARGQLLLRAALAPGSNVQVESGDALLKAREAVFNVCRFTKGSMVALASGSVQAWMPGRAPLTLAGGDTVYIDGTGVQPRATSFAAASAWTGGLFVADRLPLADLVDVFNRYRDGVIRAGGAAAQRRISGVFKLDDIDGALQQVAEILPVRLNRYGPYLSVLS